MIGKQAFWNDHVAVLGSGHGAPTSGAAVLMVDGCRYVALVATAPAHRRRGYAEAVMRRALEVAASAHGECPTVLHATDAGRPIDARTGDVPISTHTRGHGCRAAERPLTSGCWRLNTASVPRKE